MEYKIVGRGIYFKIKKIKDEFFPELNNKYRAYKNKKRYK